MAPPSTLRLRPESLIEILLLPETLLSSYYNFLNQFEREFGEESTKKIAKNKDPEGENPVPPGPKFLI